MNNLIVSLEVVAPLFLQMFLGYAVKKTKIADSHTFDQLNTMVFRVFLPILIFRNIYVSNLTQSFDAKLMIFAVSSVAVLYLLTFGVIVWIEKENRRRGVLIQGIFRSNFLIFGLPIIYSISGESFTGIASLVIAVIIPMYNILSVVALEVFRGGSINMKNILKGLITNPLIIASLLGITMLLTGFKFPQLIESTMKDLAQIATPIAFVVLGASLTFSGGKSALRPLIIGLFGKLIAAPFLGITASILFGFKGPELVVLMVMFAAPTAVSSFPMAQQMDGDGELAGRLVAVG